MLDFSQETIEAMGIEERIPGHFFDRDGRYYPEPGNWDHWVNPERDPHVGFAQGDLIRVVFKSILIAGAKTVASCVLHYILTQTKKPADGFDKHAQDHSTAFIKNITDAGGAGFSGLYAREYKFGEMEYTSIQDKTQGYKASDTAPGTSGTQETRAPLRSALLVHKGTAQAGRRGNGESYFLGVNEGYSANGEISQNALIGFNKTAPGMITVAGADTGRQAIFTLAVYSRAASKASSSVVAYPVTTFTPRIVEATQRRRQHVVA